MQILLAARIYVGILTNVKTYRGKLTSPGVCMFSIRYSRLYYYAPAATCHLTELSLRVLQIRKNTKYLWCACVCKYRESLPIVWHCSHRKSRDWTFSSIKTVNIVYIYICLHFPPHLGRVPSSRFRMKCTLFHTPVITFFLSCSFRCVGSLWTYYLNANPVTNYFATSGIQLR